MYLSEQFWVVVLLSVAIDRNYTKFVGKYIKTNFILSRIKAIENYVTLSVK